MASEKTRLQPASTESEINRPQLPPRNSRPVRPPQNSGLPPTSSRHVNHPYSQSHLGLDSADPRSSSTQSLLPVESGAGKRKLLLVYIHGFQGNETSFKSFPAHVHNILTIAVADSHVVHSKIYPRYKSRGQIGAVSEDFSKWVTPHESPETDVVLLGHSMGGLLAAEIVLLPPLEPGASTAFRHRILGTINLDAPFLGMHPGVIGSGLGSLFRTKSPDREPSDRDQSPLTSPSLEIESNGIDSRRDSNPPLRSDTLFSPPTDPNFNPRFDNDIGVPVRKGWQSFMHFVNKHADGLRSATKQYVQTTMQFGGAMADYPRLKERYAKIRALEEQDAESRQRILNRPESVPRVRFVNYYTAATGRPKRSRSPSPRPAAKLDLETDRDRVKLQPQSWAASAASISTSRDTSPRISIEEHRDDGVVVKELIETGCEISDDHSEGTHDSSLRGEDEAPMGAATIVSTAPTYEEAADVRSQLPKLPPIPDLPPEPTPLDLTLYPDKEAQKIARRDHERAVKMYKQAVKSRESAMKDRQKLEEKLRKKALESDSTGSSRSAHLGSQATTQSPSESQLTLVETTEDELAQPNLSAAVSAPMMESPQTKLRTFCLLPSKDSSGARDHTWIRVLMSGVDEIEAHCGMFTFNAEAGAGNAKPGAEASADRYERLVGDVVARIEGWLRER